jgi:NAD(P)H-dependent FMN reductase
VISPLNKPSLPFEDIMPPTNIALITCSTREPRINPSITSHVHELLLSHTKTTNWPGTLSTIDLADQNLPLYNEPVIPSHLPKSDPTPNYVHEHTRAWSRLIRQYDAFIFVTPQYNWSIPASLKNALDYLFSRVGGETGGDYHVWREGWREGGGPFAEYSHWLEDAAC